MKPKGRDYFPSFFKIKEAKMGLSAFNRYRREQATKLKAEATVSKKEIVEVVDYDEMTKAEIMDLLKEKGIKFSDRDSKSKLIELLK